MIDVPALDASVPALTRGSRAINGRVVRAAARSLIGLVAIAHGCLHLLGASHPHGAAWLAVAAVSITTGLLLLARVRGWWIVGAVAVVGSQAVIVTSWDDAKYGTTANVVLLAAVVYGWASQGPHGARAEYRRRVAGALDAPRPADPVTEADLASLPTPVAAYVRRSGAVGQPRVLALRAAFHGRIRGGPTKPWMTFTGEQINTYGSRPTRYFLMDAELLGLPVEVLHVFEDGAATMRVRALSLFTMVHAAGPEMDRAETVTVFNDLCILAPAALVDAPVTWHDVDDTHVRAECTYGVNTITAELTFNDDHELIDFTSDDRTAASKNGRIFTAQRWSTPLSGYHEFGSRHLGTVGEGRWHAPEGEFAYLEYDLDEIAYNGARPRQPVRTPGA